MSEKIREKSGNLKAEREWHPSSSDACSLIQQRLIKCFMFEYIVVVSKDPYHTDLLGAAVAQ